MMTGAGALPNTALTSESAVRGSAAAQNLKASQNIVEGEVDRGVCCRDVVETQGARAIAGLLISGFAVAVPATPVAFSSIG